VNPRTQRRYHNIIRRAGVRPERALEVGGLMGEDSLLRFPELANADRYCLNLVELPSENGITAVRGNANDMRALFDSNWFDLIMCSATLEHDKRFWRSVSEMRRVLRPGGLMIISVPGYIKDPETDRGRSTLTYRVHYAFDYYRFSEQAFREVFFDGMEDVVVETILAPPRIIGHGFKPGGDRTSGRCRSLAARLRRR